MWISTNCYFVLLNFNLTYSIAYCNGAHETHVKLIFLPLPYYYFAIMLKQIKHFIVYITLNLYWQFINECLHSIWFHVRLTKLPQVPASLVYRLSTIRLLRIFNFLKIIKNIQIYDIISKSQFFLILIHISFDRPQLTN